MMKKVLALVMILGMAGFASAGLQVTANDSAVAGGSLVIFPVGTVNFAVVNEQAGTGVFDGGAFINEGLAVMGNAQVVAANLPGTWSVIDVTADLGMPAFYYSWDVPAITPFAAGKLVTVDLTGKAGDKGKLTFANVNLEPVFSMNYTFIPEPMTLSLLGLGALVLRRRS
jgi:hypothetical protein